MIKPFFNHTAAFVFLAFLLLHSSGLSAQATVASAVKPSLATAHIFTSDMVIQQGMKAPVWGMAMPGEQVIVTFAGTKTQTQAAKDGKWILRMPEQNYGGPFQLKIATKDTSILFENVMVGEVWLASGQSNMQFGLDHTINAKEEIAKADFPNIRVFAVPNVTSTVPLNDIKANQWRICTPNTAGFFSGVAYFFAKNLYLNKKVPVGIIQSSWGGTFIEAWMSGDMISTLPEYQSKYLALNKDTVAWNLRAAKSVRLDRERNEIVKIANEGVKKGVNQLDFDDAAWRSTEYPITMAKIGFPDYWGFEWFRKEFTVKKNEVDLVSKLALTVYGDEYTVFINGKEVGHSDKATTRTFEIPKGMIVKGDNILSIKMLTYYGTAKVGEKEMMNPEMTSADGSVHIPLNGMWKSNASIEPKIPGFQDYFNTYTVIYNAMISPVMPYGIKGAIWYQGENNVSKPIEYRTLFPAMIKDWRDHWQQGNFPFLFVQLASMRKPEPNDTKLALLREAQSNTLKVPNTGMASAVDVGLKDDIHPKDKKPVGDRLALVARKVAYHENIVSTGPVFGKMDILKDQAKITFTSVGNGLQIKGDKIKGFKIAGADSVFYNAVAEIVSNDQVVVSSSQVPNPVSVRYAFEGWPESNLYNNEGLPAAPFRTDDWPFDFKKLITPN